MKRYTVGLQIPTYVWTNVEVDAESPGAAKVAAVAMAKRGEVEDWENANWDESETDAEFVNEVTEDECDCLARSWYGDEHDSACPLAGLSREATR